MITKEDIEVLELCVLHGTAAGRMTADEEKASHRAIEKLKEQQFDPVADVEAFHKILAINYEGKPRMLPFEDFQHRLKFMREETHEYEEHGDKALFELDPSLLGPRDNANLVFHMGMALDSLVDLVYVAIGNAHLHGFDFRESWRRVHAANMKKKRSQAPVNAEGRMKQQVIKPTGWEPPKHDDLVEDHIHKETTR